ncbi:MAG: Na/Pi cotransporter family protein [Clostridia bacterium]|nr:Na/Pi cotransporter family protein [Clostridia bacterium]
MDWIFNVIALLGGLAFFLYGMNVMSNGLESLAGSKLEQILRGMTSNKVKAMLLGLGITAVIQSSSATTVMLVGLVNSGVMVLGQTIGVILGANIGTTVTAWILSLTSVELGGSEMNPVAEFALKMLKPSSFTPILALIGIAIIMLSKSNRKKSVATILIGFAVLMAGMDTMSDSVEFLSEQQWFADLLIAFSNPVVGILVGTVLTAIIQSSSASVGILQALSISVAIPYGAAIPIIMGQNIGTCITALISALGATKKDATRVAVVHVAIKVIGTVVWSLVFYGLMIFVDFPFMREGVYVTPVTIAIVHTVFNVLNTVMLLPFTKQLEKLGRFFIRDKASPETEEEVFLDERLLNTPSIAVSECNAKTMEMNAIACSTLRESIQLLSDYSPERCEKVLAGEDQLDKYEDKLGSFLIKVSAKEISDADSGQVSRMLHTIGNFERLGDHAVNLMKVAEEMHEKQISFSDEANREIAVVQSALADILARTEEAYDQNSVALAAKVEPLEQVIDHLIADIKNRHIARLKNGYCTIELGFVLSDLLTNYERISDHCSNIAVAVIESEQGSFDTHEYLSGVKHGDVDFENEYQKCIAVYKL